MTTRRLTELGLLAVFAVALPALAQEAPAEAEDDFNPVVIRLTGPANLRDLANKAGYDGDPVADYLFEVAEGVVILGTPGGAGQSEMGEITGGDWGRAGTIGGGGAGGQRGKPGGNGGNAAMPGNSLTRIGGAPGNAVRLNDFEVAVVNNGQIYGETF